MFHVLNSAKVAKIYLQVEDNAKSREVAMIYSDVKEQYKAVRDGLL